MKTLSALLRVQNDLQLAVDSHGRAILVLLDLSAAFHTIDNDKLLNLLDVSFGIRGDSLKWFRSYLHNRTQSVKIGKSYSDSHTLKFGVPQGSVLGPILFTIYTTPLGKIIRKHGLTYHLYADDTQLYLAFKPSSDSSKHDATTRIEKCVEEIKTWMTNNLLKLNEDKTELIIVTTNYSIKEKQNIISLNIGGHTIDPSDDHPKNLGVIFDSTCSLSQHVANTCKTINFNLYSIGKVRKYLDQNTTEMMVNSLITSRMDFCNSLMYGMNKSLVTRLQRCQNNAARIVTLRRKYDHIQAYMCDLHWLPIEYRIQYKILLLTYKARHPDQLAPVYLKELLEECPPPRSPRAEKSHLLKIPKYRLETFGGRSFAVAAPSLWNTLPRHLRLEPDVDKFKKGLKRHLFVKAYF